MTDIHAHFAEEGYSFPEEWERILSAGVSTVVLAADTLPHAKTHAEFAKTHAGAYFTAGIHPEFAGEPFDGETFLALASEEKCVAVGEIGLDYHYGTEQKDVQRKLFLRQLELADRLALPVQVHSRDACADTLAILREAKELLSRGFAMHCYAYGAENLPAFAELGAYFSFGGTVCFKNGRRAAEAARACPENRLLTETDSPYLSPFRGEKNSPANIPAVVRRLAELRGSAFEEIEEMADRNARTLFFKIL